MIEQMVPETAVRSNRNAVLIIMGSLLCLLVTVDVIIISQQYQKYEASAQAKLNEELILAASFCVEPLLKNDFVTVQNFLKSWATSRQSIVSLNAAAPNGFNLVGYEDEVDSQKIIVAEYIITHNEEDLLTLAIKEDVSHFYESFTRNILSIVFLSIVLVILFSLILWNNLRRTAIQPLENEIAERKKTEIALLKKSKELEFSNRELEAYSYSIAHDLRTPLRSIVSLTQLLQEDIGHKLDEPEKDILKRIVTSGLFMSSLINDILNLSRVSRHEIHHAQVNLSELVKKLLKTCGEFTVDGNDEIWIAEDVFVTGDEVLLTQLMLNLLSNAYKYSGITASRLIEFGIDKSKTEAPIFLRDNGVGINMDYADKLFKPFQRLHSNHDIPGSRVGLAICKRIVDRHHGKIWIESKQGSGTTVFFTL